MTPGSYPRRISLSNEGAENIVIDKSGNLSLNIDNERLTINKPIAYQTINGTRQNIAVNFKLHGNNLAFDIGNYNKNYPLTIDPVLVYSTYFGGTGSDGSYDIAVDSDRNIYLTGWADYSGYPTISAAQGYYAGGRDAFITKLNPEGNTVIYSTYLGGNAIDTAHAIALDANGNAYVTGFTHSSDFPTLNAYKSYIGTYSNDAFVTKLDQNGQIDYSTYLGGSLGSDGAQDIAVDAAGQAYVTGNTESGDFPLVNPLQSIKAGAEDIYLSVLNSSGNSLVYSTFLGGSGGDGSYAIGL